MNNKINIIYKIIHEQKYKIIHEQKYKIIHEQK